MIYKKDVDISFDRFFLIEFFESSLKSGKETVKDEDVTLLEELYGYLLHEENVIEGFEKLARYQGTNEFSIFLFDMLDHLHDTPPQKAVGRITDLANDFIKLYQLLIDETDCAEAIRNVVEEYRSGAGDLGIQPPEKITAEAIPEKAPAEEKASVPPEAGTEKSAEPERLTFLQYYGQEFVNRLHTYVSETMGPDEAERYVRLYEAFLRFNEVTDPSARNDYRNSIVQLSALVEKLQPLLTKRTSAVKLVENIEKQVKKFVSQAKRFDRYNKKAFQLIVEKDEFIRKQSRVAQEKAAEEEVTSIESILGEYFRSEVNHRIDEIEDLITTIQDKPATLEKDVNQLIAGIRQVKEVSMIHGYSGMEHVVSLLIGVLDRLNKPELDFTEDSFDTLREILGKLRKADSFEKLDQDDAALKELKSKIHFIEETMAEAGPVETEEVDQEQEPAAEKPEEEAGEKAEEMPAEAWVEEAVGQAPADENIAFSDKGRLLKIIADVLRTLTKTVKPGYEALPEPAAQARLRETVRVLNEQTAMVDPQIGTHFMVPLMTLYEQVFNASEDMQKRMQGHLDTIWELCIDTLQEGNELNVLDDFFHKAQAELETEQVAFRLNDDRISNALFDAVNAKWSVISELMPDTFIQGEKEKQDRVEKFFIDFKNNLELAGYSNFLPFPELLIRLIEERGEIVFDNEIVFELSNSVNLVLQRLRHKGRQGDCNDITGALEELLNEVRQAAKPAAEEPVEETAAEPAEEVPEPEYQAPAAEEKAEEVVPVAEEEDVNAIFYSEVKEHLDEIHAALENLEADRNDRKQYSSIETAVHAIRSAAHLLNLESVVKLSALIEEISEIFGQSEIRIPDDLRATVQEGVEDLKLIISDPGADPKHAVASLQDFVDHIVIEDAVPETGDGTLLQEKEAKAPAVEEQPLFSESEDVDQELLNIFREEAANYLSVIEEANRNLSRNLDDKQSLNDFENATHSLKSSARMIGFREIGQITDGLEQIAESIRNGEIQNTTELQDRVASAIGIIKRLSRGEEVSSDELVTTLNNLDARYFAKDLPVPAAEEEVSDVKADAEMTEVFIVEAKEILEALNTDLLELERIPESETVLADILRHLHTIKGSAALFDYNKIRNLAHKLEDYFQIYKQKDVDQKQEMLNPAFAGIDLISELVVAIKDGAGESVEGFTPRMAEIDNRLFHFRNFDLPVPKGLPEEEVKTAMIRKKKAADDENVVRINTDELDKLVDMAADLMINQTQLTSSLDNLRSITNNIESEKKRIQNITNVVEDIFEHRKEGGREPDSAPETSPEMESLSDYVKDMSESIRTISKELNRINQSIEYSSGKISSLSKMLHNDILKTRMIPVEKLFNRYPRAVRDMAKEQGKRINLTIEGGGTEMDRAMIEALSDPVMHMIRNAVDHGLETPNERTSHAKEKTGQLTLRAHHDKNQVVIEISDDGRGIELDKVRKKIIEKKLASAAEVERMSEAEVLDYLFQPGFTTRDSATEVSGRGIGLDVVNMQIQKLKGNIRIRTEAGFGTTFSIRVPLTLLISQALMVKVNGQSVAIPLLAVQETVFFNLGELETEGDKRFLSVRGTYLPFIELKELLRFEHEETGETAEQMAVIVHDAGISVALGVNRILDRREIVVKSLGSHLQNVEYIAGGAILGSGEVGLILDYPAIIRQVELQFFGSVRDKYAMRKAIPVTETATGKKPSKQGPSKLARMKVGTKTIRGRKANILIVDDSISVRNFVGSILERNNYQTVKSSNGSDAWEKLLKGDVDLMITDLEMPEMHGFELISKIRENHEFDALPIIILTGRAGMKHRQKGESLGANSFLVKPFKENDLLQAISEFVTVET